MEQAKLKTDPPAPVAAAMRRIGDDMKTWRKLRQLTAAQVADRAGVGRDTVARLESGRDVSSINLLRIARALGVLDALAGSVDPYETDVGRLRANEALPERVRPRRVPR